MRLSKFPKFKTPKKSNPLVDETLEYKKRNGNNFKLLTKEYPVSGTIVI